MSNKRPFSDASSSFSLPANSVFATTSQQDSAKRLKNFAASAANCMVERITDKQKLSQRQKQIDFGKNTIAYERYSREVTRRERGRNGPWTPDISEPISKRHFDGKLKQWRRDLHEWENNNPLPEPPAAEEPPKEDGELLEQPRVTSGLAGLSACETSFDDFLDSALNEDDVEAEADALLASSAPPPPPSVPRSVPVFVAPVPVTAVDGSSLRARLDQYKKADAPPPSGFSAINAFGEDLEVDYS